MRCTVLANEQAIGVVTLSFAFPERGQPSTVVASGPLEPLATFAAVIGALVPSRAPLEPFRHSGRPSPPLWREPSAWPTFTLQDARGALLPTRTVACLPLRGSPSGFHVRATLDEAAAPVGARVARLPTEGEARSPLPDADV